MIKRIIIQGVNINKLLYKLAKHVDLYLLHISLISETIEIAAHKWGKFVY